MEKQIYFPVPWKEAKRYADMLDSLHIPYRIESAGGKVPLVEGDLAIVFPNMSIHLYIKIRVLFFGDGLRYPQ
ncbi:hypothetical protein LOK74_04935 [Brevibacillus humidisoli]|uniref:hypothetical protein n=1 Tax=Brevibacillus humidisoli TaxID=2895522 RepID=UPI001E5E6DBF|nr:hypothetical protein [Brevibacillus humidisoli]UFJ41852.1 hypothetical protein LOK74_04935 [Brevibacillus humidisoli]